MTSVPAFAVVGHPNKGKSAVVATLAHDDSVKIGPAPGTTTRCRRYPMKIDGETVYVLVDTPGFQRARSALAWLRQHETNAAERRQTLERFIASHRDADEFEAECELLTPLLEGAGLLYVVDGSLPFGPQYEAEMEILRWTGQPSLALINLIGDDDHTEPWRAALRQYFQVVRIFDALKAPFDAQLELLRDFGQLEEPWRAPLARAVESLETARTQQLGYAARAIAQMLADMLSATVTKRISSTDEPERYREELERELRGRLRGRERRGREAVEAVYNHRAVERTEQDVELLDKDLFSMEDWYFWGLNRRQLVGASAAGGAVVGGALDVSVGGASLLLGAAIGGAIGGVSALLGGQRLSRVRVLRLPLGGVLLQCGPTRHENFPYVVLGRALHHWSTLLGRTHADRSALELAGAAADDGELSQLDSGQRKALEASFRKLRAGAEPYAVSEALTSIIGGIIQRR